MTDERGGYMPGNGAGPGLYRWRFDGIEFDEAQFRLSHDGQTLELERKPLQVLALLLRHAGEIVTKQELFDEVWADRITVDHVLATAVGKLRRALGEAGEQRIVTVQRVGYRFVGRVERIAVGRTRTASALQLEIGQCIPGRPHLRLSRALARTHGHEVWLARHEKTQRASVFKFALDADRLYSLKREVTVARLLSESLPERTDHLRVQDWNFTDEPYWLECEHCGLNLLEWSQQEDALIACSQAQRLRLFLQIAEAVAAAHSVGVLHKDIKPANVLIRSAGDGAWQVVLSDFGISRLLQPERLEELGITGLGFTLTTSGDDGGGSPMYLAPEVIAGQPPTVRSDVYSLGVLLCQMLVGNLRTPMASGWEREIGDDLLVHDIACATDGDPGQRFASVAELVGQLRQLEARHSQRERDAAEARSMRLAQETVERLRARRPWIIAMISVLALGMLAVSGLYWKADQARQQAEHEATRAEAINRFLNWEVLANTGTMTTGGEVNPSMHGMLQRASQSVSISFADDPESEGWIRLAIGEGFAALNDQDAAVREQRQAIALLDQSLGEVALKTLDAFYTMAANLLEQGRIDEAIQRLDLADERLRRLPKQTLAAQRSLPLRSHSFRGFAYIVQMRCEESLEQLRMAEDIVLSDPSQPAFNLFNVRSWIGHSLICLGQYDEARTHFEDILASVKEPNEEVGTVLPLLARNGLATALFELGEVDMALQLSADTLASLRESIGADSVYTLIVEREYVQRRFKGNAMHYADAHGALERVYARLRDSTGASAIQTLRTQLILGALEYSEGQTEQAIEKLREVHEYLLADSSSGAADIQAASYHLASALLAAGRSSDAKLLSMDLDPKLLRAALGNEDWEARVADLQRRLSSVGDQP